MTDVLKKLQANIKGEVFPYSSDKKSYSTDESIFKMDPQIIVCPKNVEDVVSCVQIASEDNLSITARGGGTGVAGQSIGSSIILDFTKHMNQVLALSNGQAIVEPGVVLGSLNTELSKQKLKFGPDPGSWDRCTIGGMIANNAAGPHALMYGSTRDHVKELDVVLSNGSHKTTKQLSTEMQSYVKEIEKHRALILKSKRNVDKNSSGYNLESLLESPPSFEKLFTGSEGTLAMVTLATLNVVPIPSTVSFAVIGFESMGKALMSVKPLRESKACCIELLDSTILNVIRTENPDLIRELGLESAKASLWVEWNEDVPAEWKKQAGYTSEDIQMIREIWNQRSKVSKWLHAQASSQNRKPLRCIEDACVPIDSLIQYVMGLNDLLEQHDCAGAIFGHVGNGHLHVNPSIRTDLPELSARVKSLMDDFYHLVIELGGTVSGEHGDGMLRVEYAKQQWKEIWPLFEFVKKSFDPKGIFNPDRKVPLKEAVWPELKY